MKTILIITHSKDNECADRVAEHLQAEGAQVLRFDTDLYPGEAALTSQWDGQSWTYALHQRGEAHDLSHVDAIWYRRNRIGFLLDQMLEPEYVSASLNEARATFHGWLTAQECFVLDPYFRVKEAETKEFQLKLAQRIGMNIPQTSITNGAQDAQQFFKQRTQEGKEVITKMQSSFALYHNGQEEVVFTNVVGEEDMAAMEEGLVTCPMQFQTKTEKVRELRVTVIGEAVYSFEIDSQASDKAKNDWRRDGMAMLDQWQPHELPASVKDQMLQLMRLLRLNYGAADFILTPEGDYVFLEVNPSGEFFWLDRLADGEMSKQVAAVLLGNAARREAPPVAWDSLGHLAEAQEG